MKRLTAFLLVVCMLFGILACGASATAVSEKEIRDILNELEIMTYNPDGDFEEGYTVTRAQLAKILVTLSPNKGLAGENSKTSPFFDVPYRHWGAAYIALASQEGIMRGYSDGSFRPEKEILFEEAVTAILRRLGYQDSDILGSYPVGQLNVADNIGLLDGLSLTKGNTILRSQMALLLYNALNCNTKSGGVYAMSLGYTKSGSDLRLSDVTSKNTKGPYTATGASYIASLGINNPQVYIDGKTASASDVQVYDIVTYSTKSGTVWVYRNKVTGILQSVNPNKENPTSVTVSGVNYMLSGENAKTAVGLDGLEIGDTVTLLLDGSKNCADVIATEKLYAARIGYALSSGQTAVGTDYASAGYYLRVLLTDGSIMDIPQRTNPSNQVDHAVRVTFGSNTVTRMTSSGGVSGTVSAASRKIGNKTLAADCNILEIDEHGAYAVVQLSRLDGISLTSSHVVLCAEDSKGNIDGLILKDVTGDLKQFGYVVSANESSGTVGMLYGNYTVMFKGQTQMLNLNGKTLGIKTGPAMFSGSGSDMTAAALVRVDEKLISVTPAEVLTESGKRFTVDGGAAYYDITNSAAPVYTDYETMLESAPEFISAYYDKPESSGGRIRVICYKQ